jgi:outer membrane lipoprotein-sorting protein
MKKHCFKILMFLWLSSSFLTLQAQDNRQQSRQERFQKIQNYKISFLTGKLDLSPEQAQKFWPLYNQYDAERNKLRHQTRIFRDDKLASVSDQDLRDKLTTRLAVQQNILDLDKAYMDRFLKVITVRQLAVLYRSEEEFTRILLKKLEGENHPERKPAQ